MRVGVNAISSCVGGALTHLRALLPELFRVGKNDSFHVFLPASHFDEVATTPPSHVSRVKCDVDVSSVIARVYWESFRLPKLLRELDVDVVFSPSNLGHRAAGVPRVTLVHNVLPFFPAWVRRHRFDQRLRLKALALGTRHSVRTAKLTVFPSEAGRSVAKTFGRLRPSLERVIHHGVDRDAWRATGAAELPRGMRGRFPQRYILYASHIYRYKRIDVAIRLLGELRARNPDTGLVLAGKESDSEYSSNLRRLAKNLGLGTRVLFTGSLDPKALRSVHAGAALILFFSEVENCPMGVLEALASARPLLVPDLPIMRELCGEAAGYVDLNDPAHIARLAHSILTDEEAASGLGRLAWARAGKFTWKRAAEETYDAIQAAAKR